MNDGAFNIATIVLFTLFLAVSVWRAWNERHRNCSITLKRGMQSVAVEGMSAEKAVVEAERLAEMMWSRVLRLPEED